MNWIGIGVIIAVLVVFWVRRKRPRCIHTFKGHDEIVLAAFRSGYYKEFEENRGLVLIGVVKY